MKYIGVLTLLLVVSTAIGEEEITPAEVCNQDAACELPDCRCSSTNIPGGLLPRDTPQVS